MTGIKIKFPLKDKKAIGKRKFWCYNVIVQIRQNAKKGTVIKMKIGVCTSPDKLQLLSGLGYDYFEASFSWLASLDESEFSKQSAIVEKYAIAAEACNLFFKGGMKLYAPDQNQDEILKEVAEYADKGFARISAWGGKVAVIGSGGVRAIKEGMTREETDRQFARVLNVCGEAADKYGMVVTVEPLSANECNYIHTVGEGASLARLSGNKSVGVMVDFFHHARNNDSLESMPEYSDRLWHAHYARPLDRRVPEEGDMEHLKICAEALKKCPNVKRVSLECGWSPDIETALALTRPCLEIFKAI